MNAAFLKNKHETGLSYGAYLATDPMRGAAWRKKSDGIKLSTDQRTLLARFVRPMPVICLSGIWCGDCAVQCPMLDAIASACPIVDLVFLDNAEHSDLANEVRIAGGNRVPTVLWMSEEYEFVHLLGDRTLSRYRQLAATQLGAACPLPSFVQPADEVAIMVGEWLNEFERVQWILRLSPHLRQLHGD